MVQSHALEECSVHIENEDVDSSTFMANEYSRFLVAAKGHEKLARRRWQESIEHMCLQKRILNEPHPFFFLLKDLYHHAILGKTANGSYVMVDSMGTFHQSMRTWRHHGVTEEDVMNHSMLVMQWFCTHVDPRPYPGGRFVRVYDFEGFRMHHVRHVGAIRLGMRIIGMIEKYYPERLEQCIVINAPPVLRHLWNSVVKNMLDERTACKFAFYAKGESLGVMQGLLPLECLPREYGGTAEWYTHPAEQRLFAHVKKINESL